MAKKEKFTAEELLTVFHKPNIKTRVEEAIKTIEKPFAVVSLIDKDHIYEVTYVCPKCGEVFTNETSSYSMWRPLTTDIKPICCPECDYHTRRRLVQTKDETKEEHRYLLFDDDVDFITVCDFNIKETLYFCDSGDISQTLEINPCDITRYTKSTGEKSSFIFNPETGEAKPTKTRPSNLFRIYSISDDHIISTDIEVKTRNDVSTVLSKMSRVETKEREKITLSELGSLGDIPDVSPAEMFVIKTNSIENDLVSRTDITECECMLCGHKWVTALESTVSHPVLTCPDCNSTVRLDSYVSETVFYVLEYDENILIKSVTYTGYRHASYYKTIPYTLTPELNSIYIIDKKGKLLSYNRFRDDIYTKETRAKKTWYRVSKLIVVNPEFDLIRRTGITEFFNALNAVSYNGGVRENDLIKFMCDAQKYPVYEKIAKAGYGCELMLQNSTTDKVVINKKAEKLHEAFGLTKGLLKSYLKYNKENDYRHISTYQTLYNYFPDITPEEIRWCIQEQVIPHELKNALDLIPHVKIGDAISYLERVRLTQVFHPVASIPEWRDYLQAAISIGMDIKDRHVLYPRALKTEHDIVISKQRFITDEKTKENFLKAVEDYKHLEYHKDDYFVRVPASTEEMLEEGRKLHHCCGRYIDDVSRKIAFVLFLRKKADPDTPFLSMEILPDGTIRQVRGLNDSYVHVLPEYREINSFLNSFALRKHLYLDLR